MVPVAGIGNVPEPRESRPARGRTQPPEGNPGARPADAAVFSSEALEASQASRAADEAVRASAVRLERVEAAKERIREGSYQVMTVVEQVAARLTPYL